MKMVEMTVGMQVIGKETATIYKVVQIPNPQSGVALCERANGKRQYINASCLMPLTQYACHIVQAQHDKLLAELKAIWNKHKSAVEYSREMQDLIARMEKEC